MQPIAPTPPSRLGAAAGGQVTRASLKRNIDSHHVKEEAPAVDTDAPTLKKHQRSHTAAAAALGNTAEHAPADAIISHGTTNANIRVIPAGTPKG